MICNLCKGLGNIFIMQESQREFWTCQACGGAGVRIMFGPATIKMHSLKIKRSDEEKEKLQRKQEMQRLKNLRKKENRSCS